MGVHHALLQFASDAIACEVAQYLVGVWEGSCRTFACYYVAILLEEGSGIFGAVAEILLESRRAGCLLAIQDTCACQNHRGSADGTDSLACLVLGAIGMASMWTAIFADVGVMVLAVLNATRALYTKDLAKKNEQ